MRLVNVRAVVTSGASGLGLATASHLAQEGAKVTVLDINGERGTSVAKAIGSEFVQCDVTNEYAVEDALDESVARMGGINTVVNCARIATVERTLTPTGAHGLDSWKNTIDLNLTGTFNVARLAAEHMATNPPGKAGGRGVIINTTSIAAFDGQKGQTAYAASKGGVAAMTLPMARDLAKTGIRVMAIAPGIFLTPKLGALDQEMVEDLVKNVTFPKRVGDPSEFAKTVAFIINNGYLNGSVIRLDAGLRMP